MDNRSLPSVDSLRCFVAGAEQLSFRKAARVVALTPAAFSHRIKQLEEQLGCQLFERSPRRVVLTAQGQALLERARVAIDALRSCRALNDPHEQLIRITLGTRFELGLSWLMPAIMELRTMRPNWRIDLFFGAGVGVIERLSAGRVDGVITSAPLARSDWHSEVLHPEQYVFIGQRTMLEATPLGTINDTASHTLIDIDNELPLARYLLSVRPGLVFRDVWHVGTAAAVLKLVRAGHGVAVLPRYMIADEIARGEVVALFSEWELLCDTFRLIFHKKTPMAGILLELAQILRERPLS